MNNIRFDRRKKFHDKDELAYYHHNYPRTIFITMEKRNKKLRFDTIIKIIGSVKLVAQGKISSHCKGSAHFSGVV